VTAAVFGGALTETPLEEPGEMELVFKTVPRGDLFHGELRAGDQLLQVAEFEVEKGRSGRRMQNFAALALETARRHAHGGGERGDPDSVADVRPEQA